jgi:broad specificity phosphatase PhoE
MSDVYVIRHAQASFGEANYDRLSELGRAQARIVGEFLQRTGVQFDAVYSGTLDRQRETAAIVLSSLPFRDNAAGLRFLEGLNEYDSSRVIQSHMAQLLRDDPSLSENFSKIHSDRRALQRVLESAMATWVKGRYDIPGLETYRAFADRVREAVGTVMRETGRGKKVAVVTSGGPLSIVMQMALGLAPEEALQLSWQIRNASLSTFKFNEVRITLSSFNSTAHLEQHGDPALLTYR